VEITGEVGRSELGNDLFILGLPLIDRLIGGEGLWSGLHLLEALEAGEFGQLGDMVIFLAHGRYNILL